MITKRQRIYWAVSRRVWRIESWVRHPGLNYRDLRKWLGRPRKIGLRVEDCRGQIISIMKIGEDKDKLYFEDGTSASWMHCCDWPQDGRKS